MQDPETVLNTCRPLIGSLAETLRRQGITLLYSLPFMVKNAKVVLRSSMSLFCRFVKPLCCFDMVLLQALSAMVQQSKIILSSGKVLLACLFVPRCSSAIVHLYDFSFVMKQSKIMLCI